MILLFPGLQSSNFTSTQDLFLQYPQVSFWRFEAIYSFVTEQTTSALNFQINQPPRNGSCSISPLNGTTTTPFTVSCPSWFDEDGIQDYSIYDTTDWSKQRIVAFSSLSSFQVRLATDAETETVVNLTVHIRDQRDCITAYNLSSVVISPDLVGMTDLIDRVLNVSQTLPSNAFVQLLTSGNQNLVGQLITSFSQQLNRINRQALTNLLLSDSTVNVSITPLGNLLSPMQNWTALNQSTLSEFNREQNLYATFREYLVQFTTDLTVASPRSIQLQASALAALTESTSQLTRMTAVSIAQTSLSLTVGETCLGSGRGEVFSASECSRWCVHTDLGGRCEKCR